MHHISQLWKLVSLVLLFSVISGSLEIHNDDSVVESDDIDLRTENLLLVSAEARHISRHSHRSLSSLNENVNKNKRNDLGAKTNLQRGSLSRVNLMISRPSNPAAPSEQADSIKAAQHAQQDDDVDLASEGFLNAEPRAKRPSANSRKLAEFIEDEDKFETDDQVRFESSQEPISQRQADNFSRRESAIQDIFQKTLESACRDNENSNDCLQFKLDFEAMMNDENMSRAVPGAHGRMKRQVSSSTRDSGTTTDKNTKQHNSNLLDCEDDNCFSGNDNSTNTNEDIAVTPEYTSEQTLSYPTNVSKLNATEKERIAKEVQEKLRDVFKDVPGFKDIVVNPDDITIDNGKLNIPWTLKLNSSDPAFAGKTPSQIGDIVNASLKNVSKGFKDALTLDGQKPIDDFDYNDATQQIIDMANDPCKGDPCKNYLGYGNCQNISPSKVVCHHKCNERDCRNNGLCQINAKGNAVCECTDDYYGEFCDEEDNDLDGGKIAGITLGSCAIAGACCAGLFWWFCIYRRQKMHFSHYTDQEGSGTYSNASSKLYFIDRPTCSPTPLAIYQSGHQNHGAHRPSNHGSQHGSQHGSRRGSHHNRPSSA